VYYTSSMYLCYVGSKEDRVLDCRYEARILGCTCVCMHAQKSSYWTKNHPSLLPRHISLEATEQYHKVYDMIYRNRTRWNLVKSTKNRILFGEYFFCFERLSLILLPFSSFSKIVAWWYASESAQHRRITTATKLSFFNFTFLNWHVKSKACGLR